MRKLDTSEPCVVAGVALVEDRRRAVAVAVAVELPSLKRIDGAVVPVATSLPYEPGYVGFRAAPFLARALEALRADVTVALVRGHGYLHPRKFGVACHAGLVAGVSTCGVADSLLRVDGVDEAEIVSRARASLRLGEALPIVGAGRAAASGDEEPPRPSRVAGPAPRWRRPSSWPSRAGAPRLELVRGSRSSRDGWAPPRVHATLCCGT